jgi:hypothetical protein
MAEIKTLKPINAYRVVFDNGHEETLVGIDAVPVQAPQPTQPAQQKQQEPEPEPEEQDLNPFKTKNLTEQARLKRSDPKKYARLKAAAGR